MKSIGIIGANGQVGSEVSLFLSQMPGIRVVPICRNAIGAVFLQRCGLEVRMGRVGEERETRELLGDLDLVADFSLPTGPSSQVQEQMRNTLRSIMRYAPTGASLVYLSTILAYGNPNFNAPLKEYRISRNAYGSTKRHAEAFILRLSKSTGRPAYIFRVGVVHGELQAATRQAIQEIEQNADEVAYIPDAQSYTVFAFSIAEALVSAAYQKDAPGRYTLISEPAWTWLDLHSYLLNKAGLRQEVVILTAGGLKQKTSHGSGAMLRAALGRQKEIIKAYLGCRFPALERKLSSSYHTANAAFEIELGRANYCYRPYLNNYTIFPGQRLRSISDSRVTMHEATKTLARRVRLAAGIVKGVCSA